MNTFLLSSITKRSALRPAQCLGDSGIDALPKVAAQRSLERINTCLQTIVRHKQSAMPVPIAEYKEITQMLATGNDILKTYPHSEHLAAAVAHNLTEINNRHQYDAAHFNAQALLEAVQQLTPDLEKPFNAQTAAPILKHLTALTQELALQRAQTAQLSPKGWIYGKDDNSQEYRQYTDHNLASVYNNIAQRINTIETHIRTEVAELASVPDYVTQVEEYQMSSGLKTQHTKQQQVLRKLQLVQKELSTGLCNLDTVHNLLHDANSTITTALTNAQQQVGDNFSVNMVVPALEAQTNWQTLNTMCQDLYQTLQQQQQMPCITDVNAFAQKIVDCVQAYQSARSLYNRESNERNKAIYHSHHHALEYIQNVLQHIYNKGDATQQMYAIQAVDYLKKQGLWQE